VYFNLFKNFHTLQMVYIVATMLRKALETRFKGTAEEAWKQLMLVPEDYSKQAIRNAKTRTLIDKITFEHGGKEYDDRYPDGIHPHSLVLGGSDRLLHTKASRLRSAFHSPPKGPLTAV
jgi:hypothetical protein